MTAMLAQVRSKLPISFRSKQVEVTQAEFQGDAEQGLLGAALTQWHNSANGAVASSVLEVRVAERRLLHVTHRCVRWRITQGVTYCLQAGVHMEGCRSQASLIYQTMIIAQYMGCCNSTNCELLLSSSLRAAVQGWRRSA